MRFLLAFVITLTNFFLGSSVANAVATGCTASQPTYVGGTVVGYPNNYALDADMGVSVGYHDSTGKLRIVAPDGSPTTDPGNYSWITHMNSTLPASGAPTGDTTWGMCVASNVNTYFAEVYPKNPGVPGSQTTNKSTYGSTAYYSGVVSVGQRLNLLLRAPVTFQAGNGDTGGFQGYIRNGTGFISAANITGIRAFPGPGSNCGVEGYSAAADVKISVANPNRTYYKMDYLAGGQCGAPYQTYLIQATCSCGVTKHFSRNVNVVKGQWPRVDIVFP